MYLKQNVKKHPWTESNFDKLDNEDFKTINILSITQIITIENNKLLAWSGPNDRPASYHMLGIVRCYWCMHLQARHTVDIESNALESVFSTPTQMSLSKSFIYNKSQLISKGCNKFIVLHHVQFETWLNILQSLFVVLSMMTQLAKVCAFSGLLCQ